MIDEFRDLWQNSQNFLVVVKDLSVFVNCPVIAASGSARDEQKILKGKQQIAVICLKNSQYFSESW